MPCDISSLELNLELPTLLDHRSLTLRNPNVAAIFKVQAAIVEGFRKAAQELGAVEIVVPTIVSGATEGGAELFPIEYYKHEAFLSQSPQLYKQIMVSVFERVFTISHAYRAEPSVTTRHLSETTQMDMEIGFVELPQILDIFEKVAVSMLSYAQDKCESEITEFGFGKTTFGQIPRLTLRKAQEIIKKEFGRDAKADKDLTPQDEIDLCKWAKDKHGSDLVTITHFPTVAKPFYTLPDKENPEYSLSYDLLFKGAEIMSGSIRINNYEQLVKSIKDRGMNPRDFEMYLMAFKFGMPPEGGFSFGLERVTMKLLGLANIREASLFPRDMERIDERFSKKAPAKD
ncbi:MAG: aspartate--tRNA(Asn) ligase [Candidatus Levybacteria bacterium]|nr:aspartate--tRNA(Asn) ligase [Candidatus Levybacteria bacterium]